DVWGVRERAADFLKLKQDGRVGLYLVAWAMFTESPWLGKGVFTFGEYHRPSWYSFRVNFPDDYLPENVLIPWAHNLPLELLSERGVAGLGSFVWMVGSAIASVRRRLLEPRTAAALTSLAGFLGASLLDLTLMKDWVALLLFLLLALLWRLGAIGASPEDGPAE
ncbi:MAG: O-antigen ligase family protein, partial [Phycisphaerales bacterium]|nr:O-antigen ligase family protein [Phycisphaerales bacterium]